MSRAQALRRWFLALGLTLLGAYAAWDIPLGADAADMLPGAENRVELRLLQKAGLADRIWITLEGKDEAALMAAAVRVGEALEADLRFEEVFYRLPGGDLFELLWPRLPLLFSPGDLDELEERLTPEALKQTAATLFSLLNSPAGPALEERLRRDPLGLFPRFMTALKGLGPSGVAPRDGLLLSADGRAIFLAARGAGSLTDSRFAEEARAALAEILGRESVTARITGALPHTLANARAIQGDLNRLLPMAAVFLGAVFLLALRDLRGLFVIVIPLLAFPPALAVLKSVDGRGSLIALGFGIALLGIAADFALHLFVGLTRGGMTEKETLKQLRKPIAMAALTTLSVFAVLRLSEVPAHRQMALLAFSGTALAALFGWFLVPTVAQKRGRSGRTIALRGAGRAGLLVWGALLLLGAWAGPQLALNGDLRALDRVTEEIRADEARFKELWGDGGESLFLVAQGKSLEGVLARLGRSVDLIDAPGVRSAVGLLPDRGRQERNRAAWEAFWESRRALLRWDLNAAAAPLGFSEKAFDPFFRFLESAAPLFDPAAERVGMLAPLISPYLRDQGEAGVLAVAMVPEKNVDLAALVALEAAGTRVLSPRRWRERTEVHLAGDAARLMGLAGGVVVLLTVAHFRRVRPVLGALAPVLAALSAVSLLLLATGGEVNVMHLMTGLLVMGLSVDYGIFTVKSAVGAGLAVTLCAGSTLAGFGLLALADHPALQALGSTVLVGILAAWAAALLVTPTLTGESR